METVNYSLPATEFPESNQDYQNAFWQKPFKRYGGIFNLGTVEALEKLFNQ